MSIAKPTSLRVIEGIEKRFKEVSDLKVDMSIYPLKSNQISQVKTDKDKSKKFSEVFTPLWLVDAMIHRCKFNTSDKATLDLCAGYGQFSVRLLRYYYNTYPQFNLNEFIRNNHYFSELQLESCYKLIYIFNVNLNLFIGDSTHLPKLPHDAKGIWCWIESAGCWINLTKTIQKTFMPRGSKGGIESEEKFVQTLDAIINYYNHLYTHMADTNKASLQQVKRDEHTRLALLEQLKKSAKAVGLEAGHSQTVPTPIKVVDEMLDQIDDLEHKSVLVLFNAEFVERLIHKKGVDPSSITFVVDSDYQLLAEAVKKIYGVEVKTVNGDNVTLMRIFGSLKRYDVCLSNPPYNDHLHLKILEPLLGAPFNKINSIAKEYVIVHPSNWLIDKKDSSPLFVRFKTLITNRVRSLHLFNGNTVFDIGLFYPCVITHLDAEYNSNIINVNYFGDIFIVDNINDISNFGKEWLTVVKPFFSKMKKYTHNNGSVWQHNIKVANADAYHAQLAAIRGHVSKDSKSLFAEDFYSLLMKNPNENKGIRKSMDARPGPTFEFSLEVERDNFINYLKTDFVRFCLALLKITANTFYGEMELIPWLDFTQSWDDEKLFAHFDIDQKTQDYIRSFLPDYYGIRKPAKQVSTYASI